MNNKIYVLDVISARDDIDNIEKYLEEGIIIENDNYEYIYIVKLNNSTRAEMVPNTLGSYNFIPSRIAVKNIDEAKEYIKNLI